MNSNDKLNNEILSAYFDGELSQAEQLQVEQALFERPECLRQLRDWAILREGLQNTSEMIQTQVGITGEQQVNNAPNASELAVMSRIAAAVAAGQVKWAANGSMSPTLDVRNRVEVFVESSANQQNTSRVAEISVTPNPERRLNPNQRLRRWRWQLVAISTAAAGMVAVVFLNQFGNGPQMAGTDGSPTQPKSERAALGNEPLLGGQPSEMAMVTPSALNRSGGGGSGGGDNPMLSDLNNAAMSSTNDIPLASSEYTTFISYDVADPELGLQQMQSVLASNQITPVEIFEQDDSPVVVLSGDAKKLAEVLEAFQAAGDNSLALLAKVAPELDSTASLFGAQGFEVAAASEQTMDVLEEGADQPISNTQRMAQSAASGLNTNTKNNSIAPDEVLLAQDANPNLGVGPAEGNVARQNPTGGVQTNQSIASISNYRQGVIRSQANVLNNLVAPPANVTIEEFLNDRPAPKRARVPFPVQPGTEMPGIEAEQSIANQGMGAPQMQTAESRNVNPAIEPAPSAGQSAKVQQSDQQPGVVGESAPGALTPALAPAPSLAPGQAERQMRVQSDPMGAEVVQAEAGSPTSSGQTQIVVILRPKSRGQQTRSNQTP